MQICQDLEMITEEEQEKLEDENNHAQVCKTVNFNIWCSTVWKKKCIKQGKLEWKDKLTPITNELKQKFSEILWGIPKYRLCDNPKEEANQKEIVLNLTNNIPDCEEKMHLEYLSL